MKQYHWRGPDWKVFAAVAIICVGCGGPQRSIRNDSSSISRAEAEQVHHRLADAIENARRTGDAKVNIYLDEDPKVIQAGDLAVLEALVRLDDHTIIWSTDSGEMTSPSTVVRERAIDEWAGTPEPVVAGERTTIPGLSIEILGMSPGEEKTVTLAPKRAFGENRPELIRRLPLIRTFPRELTLSAETFVKRFGKEPAVGDSVVSFPYVKPQVKAIEDGMVHVVFSAEDGKVFEADYGSVTVTVNDKHVEATLAPKIGSTFIIGRQQGLISSVGDRFFTVDLNHPLAGRPVTLELKIHDLVKASRLETMTIDWLEDFTEGMDRSASEHKPAVLVLYAGWCTWSRKLIEESLQDSRVSYLSDRFIWMKIDSDEERGLKEMFDQESYPTIIVMNSVGDVVRRLDGYKDPLVLGKTLQRVLLDLKPS